MRERAPVFFFAPFVSSTMEVLPGWVDYNGHLNMAYYQVFFDRALEESFGLLGLGEDYLRDRDNSFFVAETHTLYKRELHGGDTVRVTLQLIGFDEKRLHFYMEIRHATEGWIAASTESLGLHMDMKARKVAPFPEDILGNITVMKAAHQRLPAPSTLGRIIGIPPQEKHERSPVRPMAASTRH